MAYSPLAQGALTGKYLHGVPEGSRASRQGTTVGGRYLSEENLEKIQALAELAQNRGQSLAQLALAWVLRRREVTSVLIGASSIKQLGDNIQTLNHLDFEQEELDNIDRILAGKSTGGK